jgi:sugar phosphate isomerase/epimerase
MTVTSISYWKGGADPEVFAILKRAQAIMHGHGALGTELGIVHAGTDAGAWQVSTRYADWEAFGRAMQAYAHDAELQAVLGQMRAISAMLSHHVVARIAF